MVHYAPHNIFTLAIESVCFCIIFIFLNLNTDAYLLLALSSSIVFGFYYMFICL